MSKSARDPFLIDQGLLWALLIFLGFGLIHIYSTSSIFAAEHYGTDLYFFSKQAIFSIVAVLVVGCGIILPWSFFERIGLWVWFFAVALLLLTFVSDFSYSVGGARRWLKTPFGFSVEPIEILKVSYAFVYAFVFCKMGKIDKRNVATLIFFALPALVLLKQPDFGNFAIMGVLFFFMLFIKPVSWKVCLGVVSGGMAVIFALVVLAPYRLNRLLAFLDPWADPQDKGFQVIQSMVGFASGGLLGRGLGEGKSKLFFLPEAHTDFTLSVMGEELGFLGVGLALILYGFILYRMFNITLNTKNMFRFYVAFYLTMLFFIGIFFNIAVEAHLLPPKGTPLAFLSYGGSHLLSISFLFAILFSIDKKNKLEKKRSVVS